MFNKRNTRQAGLKISFEKKFDGIGGFEKIDAAAVDHVASFLAKNPI